MSEGDKKMKGVQSETSSSVKNDDKQKNLLLDNFSLQNEPNRINTTESNVNLGLSLGGVYGQKHPSQSSSFSSSTPRPNPPAEAQRHQRTENDVALASNAFGHAGSSSSSMDNTNSGQNVVVAEEREASPPVLGPRPTSPSKVISWAIASASRNPALCRAIHQIRSDNLVFQRKGHELLLQRQLVLRPQSIPIRRVAAGSRTGIMQQGSTAHTRAISQGKLRYLMASDGSNGRLANLKRCLNPLGYEPSYGPVAVAVAQRQYQYSMTASTTYGIRRPVDEIEFQNILGSSSNSNRRAAAGIQFPNPVFLSAGINLPGSSSDGTPVGGIKFHDPLMLNSNGNKSVHDFAGIKFQDRPISRSKGKSVELAAIKFQNLPGSSSNETEFKNEPGSCSNGKSIEFAATNIQNSSGSGSKGKAIELAGSMFQNSPSGSVEFVGTKLQNSPAGNMIQNPPASGTSENPIQIEDNESQNEPVEFAANEAAGGSSSNGKPVEVDADETPEVQNPAKRVKLSNEGIGENDMKVMKKMPSVMTRGEGPDGRQVDGFLYKYKRGEVSMVCNCHGYFLNPTEFVKHAGGTDLSNPMKRISVIPFKI